MEYEMSKIAYLLKDKKQDNKTFGVIITDAKQSIVEETLDTLEILGSYTDKKEVLRCVLKQKGYFAEIGGVRELYINGE